MEIINYLLKKKIQKNQCLLTSSGCDGFVIEQYKLATRKNNTAVLKNN